MSPQDEQWHPKPVEHPELDEEQYRIQRGETPDHPVGTDPERPEEPHPDPVWQPDPSLADEWRQIANDIGKERKPRQEDVYPYLLIRAVASGDRGARPVWPPVPSWESPDILLIDASYDGPFDPVRLVVSPTAGRSYRVFVRAWNLGLLPALGVHVKAWAINPGFFGTGNQNDPYYQQHLIGGRWVKLSDRTRPECTATVELDQRWHIDPGVFGHHCLLAEVRCPADPAGGLLDSNSDRHVGMRNVTIMSGSASPMSLITTLGKVVPEGFTLEVAHAGPAVLGTLQALSGGLLRGPEDEPREIVVPGLDEIAFGVRTAGSRHLLTALGRDGRTVIAHSDRLCEIARDLRDSDPRGESIFDRPGEVRRLLDELGTESWERVGPVSDEPLADVLSPGIGQLLDIGDDLPAGAMANRFGGPQGAQHALRFTLTDAEGGLVGGYTIVVS